MIQKWKVECQICNCDPKTRATIEVPINIISSSDQRGRFYEVPHFTCARCLTMCTAELIKVEEDDT